MTYAYTGEVLLPVTVTPPGRAALPIKAHANWLVCERSACRRRATSTLDLPAGAPAPSAQAPLFAAADSAAAAPVALARRVAPDGTLSLRGDGLSPATVIDAWFIPGRAGRSIRDSAAQPLTVWRGRLHARAEARASFQPDAWLSGVLVGARPRGQETVRRGATPQPGAVPPPPPAVPLARMLAVRASGRADPEPDAVRVPGAGDEGGGAGAACRRTRRGARACRCLYRGRAAGLRRRWARRCWRRARRARPRVGLPVPVAGVRRRHGLAAVRGRAEPVRRVRGRHRPGRSRAGPGRRGRAMPAASSPGCWRCVVATPCTAPFMGAAIAAGLAAPPPVTLLVFLAMGLGMAAPYAAAGLCSRAGARCCRGPGAGWSAAAGAGVPDVCRVRLADLGAQPGGRTVRRAGGRGRAGAARVSPPGCSG